MKNIYLIANNTLLMLSISASTANAGVTSSTFATDIEGWSNTLSSTAVSFNPEGYICAKDGFWKASLAYSGDLETAYGNDLTFYLSQSNSSGALTTHDDVILIGAGLRLTYATTTNPGTSWSSYRVPLTITSGWKIDATNQVPTEMQMRSVLKNLTDLLIRGNFSSYGETSCIDNVTFPAIAPARPVGIVNNFNADNQNWSSLNSKELVWNTAGGNPRGHICARDGWWSAPLDFLGDLRNVYGLALTFDLKQSNLSGTLTKDDDVVLVGNGMTLNFNTAVNPGLGWTSYRVPFDITAGWKIAGTTEMPTRDEFLKVLASVSTLQIRGNFSSYGEEGCIDNVIFDVLPVARPIGHIQTFDTNTASWSGGTELVWNAAGGNPHGHICAKDSIWKAPADFTGDFSNAYGLALTFDIKQSNLSGKKDTSDDVVLIGNSIELRFNTFANPGTSWTAYRIPLDEQAGWTIGATTDHPTREEFLAVLSSVTDMKIRGNFSNYGETDCLDNVVLQFKDTPPSVPSVTTNVATNITQTSATLNGTVISSGATATVSFEFGKETSPSSTLTSPPNPLPLTGEGGKETHYSPLLLRRGAGGEVKSFTYTETISATPSSVYSSSAVAVSANKTGLTCDTTYHYRVKASNNVGTSMGADKAFTTNACPPTTSYTVTATANLVAGTVAGSFIPETAQTVTAGATTSFTVTANEGYITNSAVTGTCPIGSWNDQVWTTGPINANCTVIFGFTAVTSWISPPNQTVIPSQDFTLDITVKSTSVKVGQYTFVVKFDTNKLRLDTTYSDGTDLCLNGVCPGINALANRFIPVINNDTITLNGNDPIGTGPGNDLQLLVIHFKSRYVVDAPSFTTNVTLHTNLLTTKDGDNIGTGARGATINVSTGLCGDATGDTVVNIIDALGIARKIVGMPPPPTVDVVLADVNEDGRVAITDAMHIARYSVGLVTPPEVCKIGAAF